MEYIDKMTTNKHELSATELAEKLNGNTETNISQLTFRAIFNNGVILEQFSTWLLAGIGATCALVITNINNIARIIDTETIKISLFILVLSALFGFAAKYYSIKVKFLIEMDDILRVSLPKIMEYHIHEEKNIHALAIEQNTTVNTIPDIMGAIRKTFESVPRFRKKSAIEGFEKGVKDPLYGYRKGMTHLYCQTVATILQFCVFLLFIIFVGINM